MTAFSQAERTMGRRSNQPDTKDTRARRWVVLLATVATMAATASLGVWQMGRANTKLALAETMRRQAELPGLTQLPRPGPDAKASADWHRRIQLQGRWLPQHTIYLDNRQMAERGQARVGFDVLMPLQMADGTAVIVQRGWLPRDFMDRQKLTPVPAQEGEVFIEGRYAPPPPRLFEFKEDHRPLGRVRQNVDVGALAQEFGLTLRPGSVVQTGDDEASKVLRRQWALPDAGVAKHQGYAFQWFGLCALAAMLYGWFQVVAPRRRARRGEN